MSSSNCAIVCNSVETLTCGCNLQAEKSVTCSGYCTCTGNRSKRRSSPVFTEYIPYCAIVSSKKFYKSGLDSDIKCSQFRVDSSIEYGCSGVRDKATFNSSSGTYVRDSGGGEVFNTFTTTASNERYEKANGITDTRDKTTVKTNNLNTILSCLKKEITQRNSHYWYGGERSHQENSKTVYIPGFHFAIFIGEKDKGLKQPIDKSIEENSIGIVKCADMIDPPNGDNTYRVSVNSPDVSKYPYCAMTYITFAYSTQMRMQNGITYKFIIGNDDYATIKIGNDTYSAGCCSNKTIEYYCTSTGWYPIELRMHNNGGNLDARFLWYRSDDALNRRRRFDCDANPNTFRVPYNLSDYLSDADLNSTATTKTISYSGLKFYKIRDNNISTVTPSSANLQGVVKNPHMLYVSITDPTNTTYIYKGKMNFEAGKNYQFYSYFDNKVRLTIGKDLILSADYETEVGPITYPSGSGGWKDIEIRVTNHTNNIHPVITKYTTTPYAIMWQRGDGKWYPFMNRDAALKMGILIDNAPPVNIFKTDDYQIDISEWKQNNNVTDTTEIEQIDYTPNNVTTEDYIETTKRNKPIEILQKMQ